LLDNKIEKDFFGWTKLKSRIHYFNDEDRVYFKTREIWWASLGINIGKEQDGKNKRFERPVLILRKVNRYTLIVVPLSSKIKDETHRYKIIFNSQSRSVLIFQVRLISSKRLNRKIGSLDSSTFQAVKSKIISALFI